MLLEAAFWSHFPQLYKVSRTAIPGFLTIESTIQQSSTDKVYILHN